MRPLAAIIRVELRGRFNTESVMDLLLSDRRCTGIFTETTSQSVEMQAELRQAGIHPLADGTYDLGADHMEAIERLGKNFTSVQYTIALGDGSGVTLRVVVMKWRLGYNLFVKDEGLAKLRKESQWSAYASKLLDCTTHESALLCNAGLSIVLADTLIQAHTGLDVDLDETALAIAKLYP